jgi:ubiquinone/menaquinone biosynthesis C-methylase UbiE
MKTDKHLKQEWINLSAPWIKEARQGKNPMRKGLLDAPMLKACGNVKGLRVLDCGCGEGRFCRILAKRGAAYVLGIDLCRPMIEAARELKGARDEYRVAEAQDLRSIRDGTFDLAVSYLNQCDLPDSHANNREVYRVLRKNGRFIVANLHPMRSAVGGWHRDAEGKKLHVILDRYFDESERHWKIMGVEITNFHRTLATCVNGFLDAGFTVERIIEPTVTKKNLAKYPGLDDELRVPNFIIYVLNKV